MSERVIMSVLSYKRVSWSRCDGRRCGGESPADAGYGTIVAVNFTNGSLVLPFFGSEKNV
jgi:hypothetical protein